MDDVTNAQTTHAARGRVLGFDLAVAESRPRMGIAIKIIQHAATGGWLRNLKTLKFTSGLGEMSTSQLLSEDFNPPNENGFCNIA